MSCWMITWISLHNYHQQVRQFVLIFIQGTTESSVHEDLKTQSMRNYACHEPDAVGIIIEGIPVLTDLGNIESPVSAQTIQNIWGLLKTFCGTW